MGYIRYGKSIILQMSKFNPFCLKRSLYSHKGNTGKKSGVSSCSNNDTGIFNYKVALNRGLAFHLQMYTEAYNQLNKDDLRSGRSALLTIRHRITGD